MVVYSPSLSNSACLPKDHSNELSKEVKKAMKAAKLIKSHMSVVFFVLKKTLKLRIVAVINNKAAIDSITTITTSGITFNTF